MATLCRSATPSDLDDINLLFQSAERGGMPFTKRQEIVFRRLITEETLDLFVVEKDQYVVGCCHCAIVPTLAQGGRPFAVLSHFLIDPLNRRQGLATRLLSHALEATQKNGCFQVIAHIEKPLVFQTQLLLKFGFKQIPGAFVLTR
jgi:ribosomal protein S18 acetylase RimI-like enzyme